MFARLGRSLVAAVFVLVAAAPPARAQGGADAADEFAVLLAAAQAKFRRGEWSAAEDALTELFDALAEAGDGARPPAIVAAANAAQWRLDLARGRYEAVRDAVATAAPELRDGREATLLRATALARVGDRGAAGTLLQALASRLPDDFEVRHALADTLWADGQRGAARALWQANADAQAQDARAHAFRGWSLCRLGGRRNLEAASRALVAALDLEPKQREARIVLGLCKFAAYGEAGGFPSGEKDLRAVLADHVDDEEALLALYRVRSANMALAADKTEECLRRVLERNDRCVPALVLRAANVLDDRRYRDAARLLDEALAIDGGDRAALCHRAAAAWLLHDEASYQAFRQRALAGDAGWHECDRVLAEHLSALYRFADALPFFTAARQAAPDDVPTLQGMARALVCTGQGEAARGLLERSKSIADGLVDPWRNNALAVQKLLDDEYATIASGPFDVQLHRLDSDVLQAYLLPIQLEAAETLGSKYGWRPEGRTRIEVLRTWDDFSVRTIGFRGFTALGVCFGRLITLVSPVDADVRRNDFMWEATAWHEYAHVLTLGLSDNRVPRWLTEGFSVHEERARDPSWERGMDRELFDAFHNGDIPPVHLLNRLFRGPRILFGYYQGGLIVDWIVQHHGFAKAIDLLRAYGEDLDTEAAFRKALGMSSERFDAEFLRWIEQERLRGMRLVKRPDAAAMARLAAQAAREPRNAQVRVDLAWGCLQRANPVDAGRWLAEAFRIDPAHAPAELARAELQRRREDVDCALASLRKGFAVGADEPRLQARVHRGVDQRDDAVEAEDVHLLDALLAQAVERRAERQLADGVAQRVLQATHSVLVAVARFVRQPRIALGVDAAQLGDEGPHDVAAHVLQQPQSVARLLLERLLQAHDDERAVGARRQHAGIGRRQRRRAVDDDVLETLLEPAEQLFEARRAQHFGGVVDPRARPDQHQAAVARRAQRAVDGGAAQQHVAEADVRVEVEVPLATRPAQVGVDEDHLLALQLRERHREVDRRDGLAFAAHSRRHHERLRLAVGVHRHQAVAQGSHLLGAVAGGLVEEHEVGIHRLLDDDDHLVEAVAGNARGRCGFGLVLAAEHATGEWRSSTDGGPALARRCGSAPAAAPRGGELPMPSCDSTRQLYHAPQRSATAAGRRHRVAGAIRPRNPGPVKVPSARNVNGTRRSCHAIAATRPSAARVARTGEPPRPAASSTSTASPRWRSPSRRAGVTGVASSPTMAPSTKAMPGSASP